MVLVVLVWVVPVHTIHDSLSMSVGPVPTTPVFEDATGHTCLTRLLTQSTLPTMFRLYLLDRDVHPSGVGPEFEERSHLRRSLEFGPGTSEESIPSCSPYRYLPSPISPVEG